MLTRAFLVLGFAVFGALPAGAAIMPPLVFSGTLTDAEDVFFDDFTISTAGPYRVRSLGYAGGTDVLGNPVAAGGFDSKLSLYEKTTTDVPAPGTPIEIRIPGTTHDDGSARVDPATGDAFDAEFTVFLAPGDYRLLLTHWAAFHPSSFTAGVDGGFFPEFEDNAGQLRTGDFTVDVALVPLPAAAPLMLAGIAALGIARRRQRG